MRKKLRVYSIPPIDHWFGWLTPDQFVTAAAPHFYGDDEKGIRNRLKDLQSEAEKLATEAGWEGDYREGPYFAPLPDLDSMSEVMIAWKQDNNGITFIGTPYPMPWLDN